MPLIKLDRNYKNKKLDKAIRRHQVEKDLTLKEIAEAAGLTERGLYNKRMKGNFTWEELIKIFFFLGFTDEERLEASRGYK